MVRISSFLVFLIAACSVNPTFRKSSGVQVGNGMQSYYSEQGKFQMDYDSNYKLQSESYQKFTLESGRSKLSFEVIKHQPPTLEKVSSEAELKEYLETTFPNQPVVRLKLKDLPLFRVGNTYYLLTPQLDLIVIRNEGEDAMEESVLLNILMTIRFDIKKPELKNIVIPKQTIQAGLPMILNFEIEEKAVKLTRYVTLSIRNITAKQGDCDNEKRLVVEVEETSPSVYRGTVRLPHNLCVGHYQVETLVLKDRVGNTSFLYSIFALPQAYYLGGGLGLKTVEFDVSPSIEVKESETYFIEQIRVSKDKVLPENKAELIFLLNKPNAEILLYQEIWARFLPVKAPANKAIQGFVVTGLATKNANEEYSIPFTVSKYQSEGQYYLASFYLADKSGKIRAFKSKSSDDALQKKSKDSKEVATIKVSVENSLADEIAPEIFEIKIKDDRWKKNHLARIYFKATDNSGGSGIADDFVYVSSLFRVGGSNSAEPNKKSRLFINGPVTHLPDGTSYLEVPVPQDIQDGQYVLNQFSVEDRARNFTKVSIKNERETVYDYRARSLPVQVVEIK